MKNEQKAIKKTLTKSMRNAGPVHEVTYFEKGNYRINPTDLSVTEMKKILSPNWFLIERKADAEKGSITWTFKPAEIEEKND